MPASLDRLAAERALVARLLGLLRREGVRDPCLTTQPAILDAPLDLFPERPAP